MNFVKDAVEKAKGATGSSGGNKNSGGAQGSEDYGDKGVDFIEQKTGHKLSREQNEKITDGAREQFEKSTGKNIPDKFSN